MMNPHPSLSSPFDAPPLLRPQPKMDNPYEPCWCGSGKKWKWCHKDREKQSPGHIGARILDMRKELIKEGYCLHPEAGPGTCGERIIRAHTVQRKGGLKAITENGHVISTKSAAEDICKNQGAIVPREVSARDASTFMGFCNRHDDEMFGPVEKGVPVLNEESIFLLSFRALAYELFTKQSALRCMPIQRDSDKGAPFELQCFIQQHLNAYEHGLKTGIKNLIRWKSEYDTAFISKKFEFFRFYAVQFAEAMPVVGCGGFMPEFDFSGTPLQRIARGEAQVQHITYNLTVLNGVSVLAFGWTQETDGPATQLVSSYAGLQSSEKADAAVRLAFEHLENIYFRPSWWHTLPKEIKEDAVKRMMTGIGLFGPERASNCLRDGSVRYVSADVIQEIRHDNL